MFDYLKEKRKFAIKLGQIISHGIVRPFNSYKGSTLNSPEELNKLDRFQLARKAISKMPKSYLDGDYADSTLIKDTAIYIDKRIPQSFAKWVESEHDKAPSQINIDADDYGLIYHFDENKPKRKQKAAAKKTSTTISLSNSSSKYQTPSQTERKLSVDEQVKEANYQQLNKYLRDKELFIEYNLFRAVLFAMNGMTLFNQTKAGAIKKASTQFGETQKSIKDLIDELGIVSQRSKDNLNNYKKEVGRLNAITSNNLKKRMERED